MLGQLPGTAYSLVRPRGPSGQVSRATHEALGTRVALKLLPLDLGGDPELLDRLRGAARRLARLSHPVLVGVCDLGVAADGRTFLATKYVEGETARDLL